MDLQQVGKLVLALGIGVVVVGLLLVVLGGNNFIQNLFSAGTIRFEGNGFTCIVPIIASILISIVLTVVLNIVIRMINK
ncbi:MAG: hypothetical protein UZ15_CFX003002983 [Chloroflexi bacterium OLB15]|nr:MAG: hypothetical protein UZ15_CFX003002983 [Chloroflexi bacterium OLB15]